MIVFKIELRLENQESEVAVLVHVLRDYLRVSLSIIK